MFFDSQYRRRNQATCRSNEEQTRSTCLPTEIVCSRTQTEKQGIDPMEVGRNVGKASTSACRDDVPDLVNRRGHRPRGCRGGRKNRKKRERDHLADNFNPTSIPTVSDSFRIGSSWVTSGHGISYSSQHSLQQVWYSTNETVPCLAYCSTYSGNAQCTPSSESQVKPTQSCDPTAKCNALILPPLPNDEVDMCSLCPTIDRPIIFPTAYNRMKLHLSSLDHDCHTLPKSFAQFGEKSSSNCLLLDQQTQRTTLCSQPESIPISYSEKTNEIWQGPMHGKVCQKNALSRLKEEYGDYTTDDLTLLTEPAQCQDTIATSLFVVSPRSFLTGAKTAKMFANTNTNTNMNTNTTIPAASIST
jgi:hypothetical protein